MVGFVIMGVSGCGKTTVGQGAAEATGLSFIDGDDLHPPANIEKMSAGIPLTDEDRGPWLRDVGKAIANSESNIVIGCSSLKRAYRDLIRQKADTSVHFIHLHTQQSVIAKRMQSREGHFMPTTLLDSQFAALEMLGSDEEGSVVDISLSLQEVIDAATRYVRRTLA